ncbi:MAG: protein jag [Spirochaetaceae bacterium]|jgi:spoIIIJ-associated protein|nr:protein jag [Spirochaetaceae bacterium]
MIYEFEGRTEKEAIDRAAMELGIEKDEFDVEILEAQRSGLFKKGFVKIQVHTGDSGPLEAGTSAAGSEAPRARKRPGPPKGGGEISETFEKNMISFVEGLIERMGYGGTVSILYREERKLGLKLESEYSSILIGKKGKTLDALQLLANVYAGRQGREDLRIILDSENYRIRREESLVRLAYTVADKVRETKNSVLLEPMNPFDRRLIHTTLNDIADVETKSEGEGLYKQVRIYYRGLR